MAKSFRKKFAGRELEILNYINDGEGRPTSYLVMEHFGAKDCIAWRRYADEIAEKFNFEFVPRDRRGFSEDQRAPSVRIVEKMLRKVANLETVARLQSENAELDAQIKELEEEIVKVRGNGHKPVAELSLAGF